MGIHQNVTPFPQSQNMRELHPLAAALVDMGALYFGHGLAAQRLAQQRGLSLPTVLAANYGVSHLTLAQVQADLHGTRAIDPLIDPPDPRLALQYGPAQSLRQQVLPWRQTDGYTIILVAEPRQFDRSLASLRAVFGPVRMALTTADQMTNALTALCGQQLVARAETRAPAALSSRNWDGGKAFRWGAAVVLMLAALATLWPVATFAVLCVIATTFLILNAAMKLATLFYAPKALSVVDGKAVPARLPEITLLIPLHDETAIADHLLARLQSLNYPRELLDVCLVLEATDKTTRHAIGQAKIPTWMRTVVVPDGALKTKPRALNYALDFARGSIIGVYDAEDAPATDQLHVVAQQFANSPSNVACLQGVLDYYNASANWLTRCFTLEYASWFRVVLPGLERMGFVVPLGGTTLFLKRRVLEELGGWDAHNVTEDADLGVRLARRGYVTRFIGTVTEEEANGRPWPWVKQRTRWLKGYAITYGVHMRQPAALWRDLGPWRFFGIQMLFAGTLLQFLLAPILWSFWLVPFGLPHPLVGVAPAPLLWALGGSFFAAEIINVTIATIAVRRAGKPWLAKWSLTLQLYFPLAVIAVYRGFLELASRPFYWDKTQHGVFIPATPPQPPARPASNG